MTRNLKTLGLALCAVLALTAVVASTASAKGKYTAASYPATGSGTSTFGNDTFITEVGAFECEGHFTGTLTEPSSHLTVTPTYSGHNAEPHCRFGSTFSVAVHTNGCKYTFETPTGSGANWTAPVQVVCPGAPIEITVPATGATICKVTVGNQTPGGGVAITNLAGGDVNVKANVTGINYTVTQDGFGCWFNGTGAKTGGSYIQHQAMTFDSNVNIHVG